MASTRIAALNIGGAAIYSALRIISDKREFHSLIFCDTNFCNSFLQIDTLIINEVSMISDDQICPTNSRCREFANKTNLPSTVRIQPRARVMFLNNSQYRHRIANGTVGIVTDLNLQIGL
ncbi:36686_t:CDS:2, partial [Racocetra persica]